MMESAQQFEFAPVAIAVAIGLILCFLILRPLLSSKKKSEQAEEQQDSEDSSNTHSDKQPTQQRREASKASKPKAKEKPTKAAFTHAWLAGTLKGHAGTITAIDKSSNGKYIVSSSEDRTCRLWNTREIGEREHKNQRCNVQLDTPSCVRFSPDSRAFCVTLRNANTIRVYRITQSGGFEEAIEFPRTYEAADLITFSIASTGKYVLLAYADTRIQLVTLRGELLATFDSLLMRNAYATASPCSRFVAACGFSREVRVWEVKYSSPGKNDADAAAVSASGTFQGVGDAFTLSGHKAAVCHVDWSADSCRMATVSRDSTWRVYDVAAVSQHFARGASPTLLLSGTHTGADNLQLRVAFASDALTLAIATGSRLELYDADANAERCVHIDFTDGDAASVAVEAVTFDNDSKHVLVAAGRHVYALHNVLGLRVRAAALERRRAATGNANVRERLAQEVEEACQAVAALEAKLGSES